MKQILITVFLFSALLLCFSCGKNNDGKATVRYEFTASTAATYTVQYAIDNNNFTRENITATAWNKTITLKKAGGGAPTIARLDLFPPASWMGTANTADVTLKIFVDDVEASVSTKTITAADIGAGVFTIASF